MKDIFSLVKLNNAEDWNADRFVTGELDDIFVRDPRLVQRLDKKYVREIFKSSFKYCVRPAICVTIFRNYRTSYSIYFNIFD